MNKRQTFGLVLFIAGLVLVGLSAPSMWPEEVDHVTIPVNLTSITLGPYELDGGTVTIWVEDYYRGFDDGDNFHFTAIDSAGGEHYGSTPLDYKTRTIDGIRCELTSGFFDLERGVYTIYVANWHMGEDRTNSSVEVYIYEQANAAEMTALVLGTVMLTIGTVALLGMYSDRAMRSLRRGR